ncbi:MAG: SIS domain-containing protein [Fimbriimonadales bacterium]
MLGEWMQREIEEQPELLARMAPEYETSLAGLLQGREFDLLLLAARGSSDHAALYARYLIEIHLGIPAVLAAPSVITRYHTQIRFPRSLAIGISQSGSAPDVSEVLAYMRGQGHTTLAITNTPGSRLEREAEYTLHLGAGTEHSVAATKTYTASLLALYQLARSLGAELPPPVNPTKSWCEDACQLAHAHAPEIVRSQPVFALGRGYSFSTANETALKLMECALIPCKAYSTADFEHGPKALAGAGSALIVFDEISAALAGQGGAVLEAPSPPGVQPEVCPMWQILYSQWLALCCARMKGEDPDEPQFIQKVTRTL